MKIEVKATPSKTLEERITEKIDLTIALNGAIAGLVAITAGPDLQNHFISMKHQSAQAKKNN